MKKKTNQNKSDWCFDSFVKTHERKFIKANPIPGSGSKRGYLHN